MSTAANHATASTSTLNDPAPCPSPSKITAIERATEQGNVLALCDLAEQHGGFESRSLASTRLVRGFDIRIAPQSDFLNFALLWQNVIFRPILLGVTTSSASDIGSSQEWERVHRDEALTSDDDESIKRHADENQVQLDVNRSFVSFLASLSPFLLAFRHSVGLCHNL